MVETQAIGVQKKPLGPKIFIGFWAAVNGVSQDRASNVSQMDADLVGSSCFRTNHRETDLVVEGEGLHFADGFPSIGEYGHFFSLRRVAPNGGANGSIGRPSNANGEIGLIYFTRREVFDEFLMGGECFCRQKNSRSVFVQTVDNAGSQRICAWGKILAVGEKGVDEGAGKMARCRMDDHSGGFVDGEDMFVFVNNF